MPLNIPPNLPNTPGKIQLLFNDNSKYLYGKFSPYTNYHDSLLGGILSDKQPFVYTTINQGQTGFFPSLPQPVQSFGSIVGITPGTVDDVVRVSKFLISSWGVQFLISQAAIQRLAPFDETRLYNPLSPVLATIQPLTLGLGDMPIRHIVGNPLIGLANSLTSTVGINISGNASAPSSTVGDSALPPPAAGQGAGLIRGSDANVALTTLKSKWISTSGGSSGFSGLLSSIGTAFKSFFGGTPQSPGTYRADEQTSDLMYNSKNAYNIGNGPTVYYQWFMPWYNNDTGTPPTQMVRLYPYPQMVSNNIPSPQFIFNKLSSRTSLTINGNVVGYTPVVGNNTYTSVIFPSINGTYTNSDVLVNYADYINPSQNYITKITDPLSDAVKDIQNNLKKVINNINAGGTYNAVVATMSTLLPSGNAKGLQGYDLLNDTTRKTKIGRQYGGVIGEYYSGNPDTNTSRRAKSVDAYVRPGIDCNLRMATSFMSDGINMLGVISPDTNGILVTTGATNLNSLYPGWTEYKPYDDDLIAFFFYDVVNDKYIPFRATVKGISEGNTAFWDELRFIGRSDQLYSYNGFSRTLSFTFNIVINSVNELLPSWKKINYIASSVKPSNYTTGQVVNESYNRFIVPPMFMLTIGDLYKFQPMVITSINVNIPDDASWETLNENNSVDGWSYLNGLITSPNLGKNYGQLPREAEIAVTCNLLEKERAIVGGSHFGHEPRKDDWESDGGDDRFLSGSAPYLPAPTTLHKNFVQFNTAGTTNTQS